MQSYLQNEPCQYCILKDICTLLEEVKPSTFKQTGNA